MLLIAGGALLAVGAIVAIVIVLTSGGGSSKPPEPLPGSAEVQTLFANIPQAGNVLGDPTAKVTMVEYVDLQCPICKAFEEQLLPEIVNTYVRKGKLQIQARPIAFIGPDSQTGQAGAIAAGQQGKMFDFMQILYRNQGAENSGWLTQDTAERAAVSVGIDLDQFRSAIDSSDTKKQAESYGTQASQDGVTGTPTILLGNTGQTLTITPIDQLLPTIDQLTK